jgi:hypothetical protein
MGLTINLGNYESTRIDVEAGRDLKDGEKYNAGWDSIKKLVSERLEQERRAIVGRLEAHERRRKEQ